MKLKFISRFLGFVTFLTGVSVLTFTLANYVHVPIDGIRDLFLNAFHFFIVSVAVCVLYYAIAVNKYIFTLVFPLITLLSAILAYFVYFQNLSLTTSVFDAALGNDLRTSMQLITFPLILFIVFGIVLSVAAVYLRFHFVHYRFSAKESLLILILAVFVIAINASRNNTLMQRIPFNIWLTARQYVNQLQEIKQIRTDIGSDALANADSITVVFVIGEACRANHLQLNGYKRETNPKMSKRCLISFPSVYSEWTHTNSSIPHILTRSDSINHQPAFEEKSVIQVFNQAGFFTMWIANQEPARSYISFVKEAKCLHYVNPANSVYSFNKKWLDTDNLPFIDVGLKKENPKKLIVVHTIGSHWWYNDHYTDSFAVFKPVAESKIVSSSEKSKIINSYDNTILFTDFFLDQVIGKLENRNACLIYLSDHGESLGENGKWLHAQDNGPEHYPACLVWCSEKYKKLNPDKWQNLQKNRLKRWRTDFLFHSILSLGGIVTEVKKAELDITDRRK